MKSFVIVKNNNMFNAFITTLLFLSAKHLKIGSITFFVIKFDLYPYNFSNISSNICLFVKINSSKICSAKVRAIVLIFNLEFK